MRLTCIIINGDKMGLEWSMGRVVYGFVRKKASSDLAEYFNDKAEEKDLRYIIENSCMVCGRLLGKNEIRVIPPQYMQSKDKYVAAHIVARRAMCVPCHNRITSGTREKAKERYKSIDKKLNESIVKTLLFKSFAAEKTE